MDRTEVETVALAIYESRLHTSFINGWSSEPEALRERFRKAAIAALDAVRRSPQDEDHEAMREAERNRGLRKIADEMAASPVTRDEMRALQGEDHKKLSRLRSALERVESHGSGIAVTIAREALAEFTAPKEEG